MLQQTVVMNIKVASAQEQAQAEDKIIKFMFELRKQLKDQVHSGCEVEIREKRFNSLATECFTQYLSLHKNMSYQVSDRSVFRIDPHTNRGYGSFSGNI